MNAKEEIEGIRKFIKEQLSKEIVCCTSSSYKNTCKLAYLPDSKVYEVTLNEDTYIFDNLMSAAEHYDYLNRS